MTKSFRLVTIGSVRETSWRRWPDRQKGPWKVYATTAIVNGRWELTGLSIEPDGLAAVLTSTVLKKLRLPELFADHQRQIRASNEFLAAPGRGRIKVTLGGRELSPSDAGRFLNSASSAAPRTGRPTHWTPTLLAEVGQVYRVAWSARKPPTEAVAAHFNLSASGAAKVVRLARAKGLLPMTTRGKAGWIETAPQKDRKGKER